MSGKKEKKALGEFEEEVKKWSLSKLKEAKSDIKERLNKQREYHENSVEFKDDAIKEEIDRGGTDMYLDASDETEEHSRKISNLEHKLEIINEEIERKE